MNAAVVVWLIDRSLLPAGYAMPLPINHRFYRSSDTGIGITKVWVGVPVLRSGGILPPSLDGKYFLAHRSVEKTCAEIARYNSRDAEKYVEFNDFWQRVISILTSLFNAPPKSIVDMAGNFDFHKLKDTFSLIRSGDQTLDLIRSMFTSPLDLINEYFDLGFLKAPLARLAAALSTPPSQKNMAVGAIMMCLRHNPGMARPKGGTGALAEALVRCVKALGGDIRTEQPVQKALIGDNRAVGVRLANGQEYRAKCGVISSLDAQRLFLQLVDLGDVDRADAKLRDRVARRITNHNEAILKIDCALSEPPRFIHHNHQDEYRMGAVLIADSVNQVELAHTDPAIGRIPLADPLMYVVVPTMRDPSMAPPGHHMLWIEFFAPYQIASVEGTGLNGTGWTEELKAQVADRVLAKLADYAPNLPSAIIARHIESPPELEQRIGVSKGNYYHLDMTFDQMMFFRPLPELANYKTPITGLYLTGAGTHPGGSISGLPGRNCARVFLQTQQPFSQFMADTQNTLQSTTQAIAETIKQSWF